MKKIFLLMAAITLVLSAGAGDGLADDDVRHAIFGAMDQAAKSLKKAPFGQRKIAILPFRQANNVLAGKLKNIVTQAGFYCVEGKDDPMWNEILAEIEWDERKSDILDASTIAKFGKLKAAQILLYGKIQALDKNDERIFAMIELHATDIATKQHIWGGNFAYRFYRKKDVHGIITLDNGLRKILKKSFSEAQKMLQSPATAGKLSKIKSVAIIPLAGDVDDYMTGLVVEIFTETNHVPKVPEIPSLSQYRAFARDGQIDTDAVFYGSVRDLRRVDGKERAAADRKMESDYTVFADVQLFLEESRSGAILWSKTITLEETVTTKRDMTREEIAKYRKEKVEDVSGELTDMLTDNWKSYLKIAAIVIGCLVALGALILGLKAYRSFHDVR